MKTYQEILEFSDVLSLLKKYIKTYSGIKVFSNVSIFKSKEELLKEYGMVIELIEYLKSEGNLSFEEAGDIEEVVTKSRIEGYFASEIEVLEVFRYLKMYKEICDSILSGENGDKYRLVVNILKDTNFPIELYNRILNTFDENGIIRDDASEELFRIRKRKYSIRNEVQSIVDRYFKENDISECLQEKSVSFKDQRFVIAVKTAYKNYIKSKTKGIIHSYSHTKETVYIEPADLFLINEEMMEIEQKESMEIENILRQITKEINNYSNEVMEIFNKIGILEWIYARARFGIDNNCHFPLIVDKKYIKLKRARHPLLHNSAVPLDIEVGERFSGLIVSGPNAGGKTVLIKTAGLLTEMALCAIPIPAEPTSEVGMFEKIMAEIGDEQSISNNLSSFSAHILSISKILKEADENSLVLIDEIAASTDPKEGEALAIAIVEELLEKNAKFIITTHFPGLKEFAIFHKDIENASMEFDEKNFKPLYKVRIGGFGKSYALEIATLYDLGEDVVNKAKKYLYSNLGEIEKKMSQLESLFSELKRKKEIIEKNIIESKKIKEYYEGLKSELEKQKQDFKKEVLNKIKEEYDSLMKEISKLKEEIKAKRIDRKKDWDKKTAEIKGFIDKKEKELIEYEKPDKINVGDMVFVRSIRKEGYVETISEDKIKVRIGILSLYVDKDEIYKVSSKNVNNFESFTSYSVTSPPLEIMIRGLRVNEALKIVEKAVDDAVVSGSSSLHIIHGKGEGILRKVVWEYLSNREEVESFAFARPEEGGQGKTIVFFKK